jgi:hypothetical protein
VRLVHAVRELGFPVYLTENDTPDSFLRRVAAETGAGLVPADAPILQCGAVLAHARLFISGRYHPSIFAALGGTPCIFLGSHAHKMQSISRLLGYETEKEFNGVPSDPDIDQIVALANRYLAQGDTLRTRIRHVAEERCGQAASLPAFILRELHGSADPQTLSPSHPLPVHSN